MILISGPCVIENEKETLKMAETLKEMTAKFKEIKFIFKASFDKANRTSIGSYRGVGIDAGLKILRKVKEKVGVKITTDVHECWQVKKAAEVVDIIQIPAFLCRQTDLIIAVANTGRPINIKKGQFMAPWDMINVIKKIDSLNIYKWRDVYLTERGTCFGYNNLVFDPRSIPIMKSFGYPVIIDASHSVQKPAAGNGETTGEAEFIPVIAKAAIVAGADGIFVETHFNPSEAKCDHDNCLTPEALLGLLPTLFKLKEI